MQTIIPTWESAAWTHLMLGDEEQARGIARDIVERSGASRFLFDSWSLPLWLMRRAGELERYEAIREGLERFDMPLPGAYLAWLDGLLGESEDPIAAAASITDAADKIVEFGLPTAAAFALSDVARISDGLGDTAAATGARSNARALLDGQGVGPFLDRLGL
jgi:hypothetical protein